MMTSYPPTFGLVLAGGLARRMGGCDKARIEIGGVFENPAQTLGGHTGSGKAEG